MLSELTSESNHIAATWIRLIPVADASKDVIIDPITGKSVKVPLRTTADLIGMDYTDTIDLLIMGGFLTRNKRWGTLQPVLARFDELKSTFDIHNDIVPVQSSDIHNLGTEVWVFRIGSFVGTTFNAKTEAKNINIHKWRQSQLLFLKAFNYETCNVLLKYQVKLQEEQEKKWMLEE
jgi:hypothetical protein